MRVKEGRMKNTHRPTKNIPHNSLLNTQPTTTVCRLSRKKRQRKSKNKITPTETNPNSKSNEITRPKSVLQHHQNNSILVLPPQHHMRDQFDHLLSNQRFSPELEDLQNSFNDNEAHRDFYSSIQSDENSWENNSSNQNSEELYQNDVKTPTNLNRSGEYSLEEEKTDNPQRDNRYSREGTGLEEMDPNSERKKRKRLKYFNNYRCPWPGLYLYILAFGILLIATIITAVILTLLTTRHITTTTTTTTATSTTTTTVTTTTTTVTTTTTTVTTTTTSTTSTTSVSCSPSCINGGTCVSNGTCQCTTDVWIGSYCQTPVRILWRFDNDLNDFYGNYPGVGINGPTYKSPGINGYGTCLYLNASANQSVTIYSPPFLNMAYTSFSLLAWVKASSLHNANINGTYSDNAVFGQFQANILDQSLHIIVRNQKIYLGFYYDDLPGNTVIYPGAWYHMGYIYDYSTFTQYVYVNGILDVSNSSKGPYKGTTGSLTIGTNGVNYPFNFWDGCLDQISYFGSAKSATEVLRYATSTLSYTFDNNTLLDSGPLGINGTGTNYSYSTSGQVNQCLSLLTSPSYVQATGLVLLGTVSQSYSFSLWIQPTVVTQGTIIHVSSLASGLGWCIPMLGFTSAGAISVQSWKSSAVTLIGPTITTNVWTHVGVTYSLLNGLRLWINGTQYGSASSTFNYTAYGSPVILTLGSSLTGTGNCSTSFINTGQYYGYIDEFGLYSRELSSSDIYTLANP